MNNRSSSQKAAHKPPRKSPSKIIGRPRDPAKEALVLDAALQLLKEVGFENFSIAKVAALSGVARPTIRLRWASKEDLSIAVVEKLFDERTHARDLGADGHGDAREKIRVVLSGLIEMISEPGVAKVLSSLVAVANYSEPLSQLRKYILNRRGIVLRGLLEQGIARGQFAPDLDIERALDALNGPILFRMLIMNLPMDAQDADFIIDMVLPVYGK